MPSVAAKSAAFVFLMIFRTAYTLISENNHPLTCKHDEFEYFLKPAVNSNLKIPEILKKYELFDKQAGWKL